MDPMTPSLFWRCYYSSRGRVVKDEKATVSGFGGHISMHQPAQPFLIGICPSSGEVCLMVSPCSALNCQGLLYIPQDISRLQTELCVLEKQFIKVNTYYMPPTIWHILLQMLRIYTIAEINRDKCFCSQEASFYSWDMNYKELKFSTIVSDSAKCNKAKRTG